MTDSVEVAITSEASGQLWSISVWDSLTGSQLMTYKGGGVCGSHSVSLAGTDYIVAAEKTKPLMHVWPINSTESSHELRTVCPGIIGALAVSPDGKYLVAGVAEKIHVWQVEASRLMCVVTRHFQPVTCIRFSEDGSHFVSAGEDGMVLVWCLSHLLAQDGARTETVHSFSDHYLAVKDVFIGSGGSKSRIVSVSVDGSCRVYDFGSGKLLLSLIVDAANLTSVTADVLESSLFLGCNSGDILTVSLAGSPRPSEHHLSEKERESVFRGHTKAVSALSPSQDASTLLSGSLDETVRLWHIDSKQCLRIIQHKGPVLNAFLTFLPSQMFAEKLKPSLNLHRLQRVNDCTQSTELHVEISTVKDLQEFETAQKVLCPTETVYSENSSEVSSGQSLHKEEFESLRKKNLELFKFASEKIFNGILDNGQDTQDSIPGLVNVDLCIQQVENQSLEVMEFLNSKSKVKVAWDEMRQPKKKQNKRKK